MSGTVAVAFEKEHHDSDWVPTIKCTWNAGIVGIAYIQKQK